MSYRYRIARAMGKDEYEKVMEEDIALLNCFGAQLMSVQGGMRAALKDELKDDGKVHPWNLITIDEKTWEWLRPMLVELRGYRSSIRMAAN